RQAFHGVWPGGDGPDPDSDAGASATAAAPERPAPPSPLDAPPGRRGDVATWTDALKADGKRIVISREQRHLWLMEGDSVLFSAPVAVGRDTIFHYGGTDYDFSTPTGRMRVLGKEEQPEWVPPDWHYFEK